MAEHNRFTSITETYLENRRRSLSTTLATTPPQPSPSRPSTSSAPKHPMFGPIPPHLLHRYLSPNLSHSNCCLLDHEPSTPPASDHLPQPLSSHTHICPPPSQQPSSSSANQVSPTLQSSSSLIEIIEIEDDPSETPLKNDIVTRNPCRIDVIIIDDEDDTQFCDFLAKHETFILEEISRSALNRNIGKGTIGSTSELKGKNVSDNSIERKRKSDDIYFGPDKYDANSATKRCF